LTPKYKKRRVAFDLTGELKRTEKRRGSRRKERRWEEKSLFSKDCGIRKRKKKVSTLCGND